MNFSIKIYPKVLIPGITTWGEIKEGLDTFMMKHHKTVLDFNLIDSHQDHARLIIQEADQLKLILPSQIVKRVETEPENSEKETGEKKVSIRYVYGRKIEFVNWGKLIYWNLDFGIKGLYDINEELMEEVEEKMLSEHLYSTYKKALNVNKYLVSLETDLETGYFDPIWFFALVFCRLVYGVAFVEHSFPGYFLAPGYYEISELESICVNGLSQK